MTAWDQLYLENQTPWDKGSPAPPLVAWLSQNSPPGRALVPGCGLGHDVAHLLSVGIDAYGLDLSPTAIERAKARYPAHHDRFWLGDLFALPPHQAGPFDLLFEHTCLCALPPELRPAYADTAARLLRPGGRLIGIWFIDPDMSDGETGPPFGISLPELTALFPADQWRILEEATPTTAYAGREGREHLRILEKLP
ncbi:MAG: methyltransferase domain-containing protein [Brevundimonas sp.]|uniref:methyltransferase domain-containing protein n=1 Tax=Brevundimonas sp. TaxID=1871086 RepID=UPI00273698B9|nr:methyltransferase domain-containing protein [Brevundimonas sp.]MDP3377421.1 methyltransferase domain-containing protein [Brevundimonas sp.]